MFHFCNNFRRFVSIWRNISRFLPRCTVQAARSWSQPGTISAHIALVPGARARRSCPAFLPGVLARVVTIMVPGFKAR